MNLLKTYPISSFTHSHNVWTPVLNFTPKDDVERVEKWLERHPSGYLGGHSISISNEGISTELEFVKKKR